MQNKISQKMTSFAVRLLPRILTQACRDPGSPDFGSFDRNWWHYKIRDFSSVILQQGGYAALCASELPQFKEQKLYLRDLAASSCRFWNKRARKYGAFEEYYPWEQGYPPLAFSTLAVAKMVHCGVVNMDEVELGLKNAVSQLQKRFESKATNQQLAGMAALCWICKIAPSLVDQNSFKELCERTLACQHEEGWYMEYGGPDLGYLSVSMDCLWDAYDATDNDVFYHSAKKALEFISYFTACPGRGAAMHNARNTDYIVPYGISRFLHDKSSASQAKRVIHEIFSNADQPSHFFYAIDDRYFCHYIGHSIFRALPLLEAHTFDPKSEKTTELPTRKHFPGSGHILWTKSPSGCAAIVSAKKGGIFTLWFEDLSCSNFGWVVTHEGRDWVNHWWANFWNYEVNDNSITISGYMTPHNENESTPFKHLCLRGLSFFFGYRIIGILKEKLIFKQKQVSKFKFSRTIKFTLGGVEVTDHMDFPSSARIHQAPRSSKRHVASADSYHREDSSLLNDHIQCIEQKEQNQDGTTITTIYKVST